MIKNVLNAIEPRPIDAPIAKPSPKLCRFQLQVKIMI